MPMGSQGDKSGRKKQTCQVSTSS